MKFESLHVLYPGVFYSKTLMEKDGYYFLPTRMLQPCDDLYVKDFEPALNIRMNFTVGIVGQGGYMSSIEDAAGFLFYSKLPVFNYGTAVLSYSKAWQKSMANTGVTTSDTLLVLRTQHFYIYNTSSIATLVTCPDLSDDLESYLTMI